MAIHIEKIGHIAPLQKCLNINILSLFDLEQVQRGFLGNGILRELVRYWGGNTYVANLWGQSSEKESKTTIRVHIVLIIIMLTKQRLLDLGEQ